MVTTQTANPIVTRQKSACWSKKRPLYQSACKISPRLFGDRKAPLYMAPANDDGYSCAHDLHPNKERVDCYTIQPKMIGCDMDGY